MRDERRPIPSRAESHHGVHHLVGATRQFRAVSMWRENI